MSDLNFSSPFSTQVVAIGRLMEWLRHGHQVRMDGSVNNKILTLDDSLSQRFAIGFPKRVENIAKPFPFIGIQRTERAWMHPMQWKGAYVKEGDRRLYFVTATTPSNDIRHPDIPSFAIAVTVNDSEKLSLLFRDKGARKLEGREMWIDENLSTRINLRSTLFSMPLTFLDSRTPIPLDSDDVEPVSTIQSEAQKELQYAQQHSNSIQNGTQISMKAGVSLNPPRK